MNPTAIESPKRSRESIAPKVLSRRVLVNIVVDSMTHISKVVWQHELPILDEIYGEGMVKRLEPETLDEGYNPKPSRDMLIHYQKQDVIPRPSEANRIGWVFVGSPAVEYERLVGAYGMHPEVRHSWAEHVYGRAVEGKLAAVLGRPALSDLPEAQLRALIRDYGDDKMAAETPAEDLVKVAAGLNVEM